MYEIVRELDDCVKKILDSKPMPDGKFFVSNDFANKMVQKIKQYAELYKQRDTKIYAYIGSFVNSMFIPVNYTDYYGGITSGCLVHKIQLGFLQATLCFYLSDSLCVGVKEKEPKIFISHSKYDIEYVKAFVSMLEKIGIKQEHLFCSSISGYNIPLNENIYDFLRNQFENYNLFVILMLSKNYYKSPACLNEMGAAWALKANYQSILLPFFEFKNIDGAIDPRKISFNLGDVKERPSRLTELKNKIISFLGIENVNEIIWERHKTGFIDEVIKIHNAQNIEGDKK